RTGRQYRGESHAPTGVQGSDPLPGSQRLHRAGTGRSIGRYQARGVSSDKTEVHEVVDKLDHGLFPGAFCKITDDFLTGNPDLCNVIHADGSGTKSIIAYLAYKESGKAEVFHGISQDSIVMNLD